MGKPDGLNAHERPPGHLKDIFKHFHRLPTLAMEADPHLLDFNRSSSGGDAIVQCGAISKRIIADSCSFLEETRRLDTEPFSEDVIIYEARNIPGLRLIPSLINVHSQRALLAKLLHRDLADPRHKTNVHLHHRLPYDAMREAMPIATTVNNPSSKLSFFNMSVKSCVRFLPIESDAHKPFSISQFLERKLRWMTLGGQYDWTKKCYPPENPPFPADLAAFVQSLFPDMKAEAAIVNVYTPSDTLSMHRDVSEDTDKGLVSISLGCDGIFVVGIGSDDDEDRKSIVIRLRSGDAVFMSGSARFAWHGVPQILPDTCPHRLRSWPAEDSAVRGNNEVDDSYESWRGWMSNKRINLNIRQMKE